jgi:glycosyltransferase involved in cell wall biosynthesis
LATTAGKTPKQKSRKPAGEGPLVSVIMPVRDGARYIAAAIEGLRRSTFQAYELIVIDDASVDGSGEIAAAMGAVVIRPDQWGGASAARMSGAERARGQILAFVDADVVVHPDALSRLVERLATDPGLSAVFGAYDDAPHAPAVLSRFRNLLHTYFHRQGDAEAYTFWTGLGAVRRPAFDAVGGFVDAQLDDIKFGVRLREAGYRIALDTSIQGTHLKDWTLPLMVRTDIFMRGAPWIRLALARGFFRDDLNTSVTQRASVAAAGALLALLAVGAVLAGPRFVACVAGAAFSLSMPAWGEAGRSEPGARSLTAAVLLSLGVAGALFLSGAALPAVAVLAVAAIRILGRPAYRAGAEAAGWALALVAVVACALSLVASPPSAWGFAALAVAAVYVGLNVRIVAFMASRMGPAGGVAALPLLFVYHVSCGLAVAVGLAGHLRANAAERRLESSPKAGEV